MEFCSKPADMQSKHALLWLVFAVPESEAMQNRMTSPSCIWQAIGDTWEQYPELKLKALKRMQQYAVRPEVHMVSQHMCPHVTFALYVQSLCSLGGHVDRDGTCKACQMLAVCSSGCRLKDFPTSPFAETSRM